ncbi:MAG TPA: hypothetical protein VM166_03055 [Gemmatimonadaceae bacterium]|nr:hypothetical protein [Gemmatimonadaceae bacterium]
MRNRTGEGALLVAFMAVTACADPANRIAGPTTSSADVQTGIAAPSEERAALSRITRLVAVALDNEPARQHLKRDMRAAPFREHKLELKTYLRSKDGKALLSGMVAAGGRSETDVFNTLNAVRPVEFYMPAARHREKWNGKGDVLVLSQLEESEPIVAFDEVGRIVALDRSTPPDQPTLALIPVETDFAAPMNPLKSRNVRDENGDAIGTLEAVALKPSSMVVCDAYCDGGGGDGSPPPPADGGYSGGGGGAPAIEPGLYLEFSRILDMKEPWFRGDPEIEVHIVGPRDARTPKTGEDLSCSGEHATDNRKVFNQDTGFWEGRVMLYSASEMQTYAARFNDQGFHILFWEDDNDDCLLKFDANAVTGFVRSAAEATLMLGIKILPGTPPWVIATSFLASLFRESGAWLLTNDDYLGIAAPVSGSPYELMYTNSHVLLDGKTLNGRLNIVAH